MRVTGILVAMFVAMPRGGFAQSNSENVSPPSSSSASPVPADPIVPALTTSARTSETTVPPILIGGEPGSPIAVPSSAVRLVIESPRAPLDVELDPWARRRRPDEAPYLRCTTPCTLEVDRDRYRLVATQRGGPRGGDHFEVGPFAERIFVRPARSTSAPVFTIAGGALAFITGSVFAGFAAATCYFNPCPVIDTEPYVVGGISLLVAGAAIAALGGYALSRSSHVIERIESIDERPLPIAPPVATHPAPTAAPAPAASRTDEPRELRTP